MPTNVCEVCGKPIDNTKELGYCSQAHAPSVQASGDWEKAFDKEFKEVVIDSTNGDSGYREFYLGDEDVYPLIKSFIAAQIKSSELRGAERCRDAVVLALGEEKPLRCKSHPNEGGTCNNCLICKSAYRHSLEMQDGYNHAREEVLYAANAVVDSLKEKN